MSNDNWTDDELRAWLDEQLPADRMTELEADARTSEPLRNRFAALARQRDQGGHSVGEIWRRNQISCPSRSELGGFLLGTLDQSLSDYIDFHIRTVGCRLCSANLSDLEQEAKTSEDSNPRRRRFFESSAGLLQQDS